MSPRQKHCKFRPDPGVPELFTARNEDFLRERLVQGGHMALAGDNKFSEVFRKVPSITGSFTYINGEVGMLSLCQLIGKHDVAVPTHLYKVVLAQRSLSEPTLGLGAFVVPNQPIGYDHPLTEFHVSLVDLEKLTGLRFFPKEDPAGFQNLCEVDSCKLLHFKEFTLYITGRKVKGTSTMAKLEKSMSDIKSLGITPDDYLLKFYQQKREELLAKETAQGRKP